MGNEAFNNMENNQSTNQSTSGFNFDKEDLINRTKEMLLTPKESWPKVKEENLSIEQIYKKYLIVLAAIYPICNWIGMSIIGISIPLFGRIRAPFFSGLISAVFTYVLSLAGLYLFAIIIEKLAPKFEGSVDTTTAFKLVAFSMIPSFLGGVFGLIPSLNIIGALLGIYSIYIFYTAIPVMTSVPETKRLPFFGATVAACVVAGVVIFAVLGMINHSILGIGAPSAASEIYRNNPDLEKLEEGMKELQKMMPKP